MPVIFKRTADTMMGLRMVHQLLGVDSVMRKIPHQTRNSPN